MQEREQNGDANKTKGGITPIAPGYKKMAGETWEKQVFPVH
jgi:hypothetical protein